MRATSSFGLDAGPFGTRACLGGLASPPRGPVRNPLQHRLPTYLRPAPAPAALALDALSYRWAGTLSYAFPPIAILGKVLRIARLEQATLILVAPHRPAQPWYPDLLSLSHVPPLKLCLHAGAPSQPQSGVPHRHPEILALHACPVRSALYALGASSPTVDLVFVAHRSSTLSVYSSAWSSWLRWCSAMIQTLWLPLCQVGQFPGLSSFAPSPFGFGAAVSATLRQIGGPSFSDDPLLKDVVRATALQEAREPRRTPEWYVFLVLASLRNAPYEPLASCSLMHLTLKTAFLLRSHPAGGVPRSTP